jgi:hypothetical protein
MIYFCGQERRRSLVRAQVELQGIDHLEVEDAEPVGDEGVTDDQRQRVLRVFFVEKPLNPTLRRQLDSISPAHVRITGGDAVRGIRVEDVGTSYDFDPSPLPTRDYLEVVVDRRGDFSTYTLSLVEPSTGLPPAWLDPQLASVDFSFKVECPSDFDCRRSCDCPAPLVVAPNLDYLAKDYASFRQLMLDRLALLLPDWRERNPADLGVTLVELLAYVGDYLSYRQDAIATEAYLGTARRRVSVRRHARLVDYPMHDGCNARTWVQVRVTSLASNGVVLAPHIVVNSSGSFVGATDAPPILPVGSTDVVRRTRFLTRIEGPAVMAEHDFQRLTASQEVAVFEPMERAHLFPAHNEMRFYTWGSEACCLPKGATKAALVDGVTVGRLRLRAGDVLVFAEKVGPRTGDPADADPFRRHAVRLTRVNPEATLATRNGVVVGRAAGKGRRFDQLTRQAYVEIEWAEADALPFPFCLSARAAESGRLIEDVSVAWGNIVRADHGATRPGPESLPEVPSPNPALAPVNTTDCGQSETLGRRTLPARYQPALREGPITQAAGYDPSRPASAALGWSLRDVLPSIRLADQQGRVWTPRHDLLSSDAFAPEFVVEVETDGRATIRFGDDENGMRPGEGARFEALYRVGNGVAGNIAAESLAHLVADYVLVPNPRLDETPPPTDEPPLREVSPGDLIESVRNPLPARGGLEPETLEAVRRDAPVAFRVQERAVTPQDYADKAGLHPDVQRAAATLRWTGSWHTIFLTVDRRGGRLVDSRFEAELRAHLERFRLAGHDLEVDGPRFVPLELTLEVCVAPGFFRSDVVAALRRVFDNRLHPDGTRGFFHPDHFSFGQSVSLSQIAAEAHRVPGVRWVDVTVLRRQGDRAGEPVPASGIFSLNRLEIARLDNDPNFPDRGVLQIEAGGGR